MSDLHCIDNVWRNYIYLFGRLILLCIFVDTLKEQGDDVLSLISDYFEIGGNLKIMVI